MSINFDKTNVTFDEPVTSAELRSAVGGDGDNDCAVMEYALDAGDAEKQTERQTVRIKEQDIKFSRQTEAHVVKTHKSKSKSRKKTVSPSDDAKAITKNRERQRAEQQRKAQQKKLRDGKTRKYTNEMRNRDAIEKSYRDFQKQTQSTSSSYDDKFIHGAKHADARFDDAIYNMPTTEDALDEAYDIVDDIVDDVEMYDDDDI